MGESKRSNVYNSTLIWTNRIAVGAISDRDGAAAFDVEQNDEERRIGDRRAAHKEAEVVWARRWDVY